jgi:hypothetical protein
MCLIPIDLWLRGPLCDCGRSLLSEEFFQPESILEKSTKYLNSHRNSLQHLWNASMFYVWKG